MIGKLHVTASVTPTYMNHDEYTEFTIYSLFLVCVLDNIGCFMLFYILHSITFYRVLMLIYTVNDRYGVYTFSTYIYIYIYMCSVRTAVAIKKKTLELYSMHMSVDIFYIRNNIFLLYININVHAGYNDKYTGIYYAKQAK